MRLTGTFGSARWNRASFTTNNTGGIRRLTRRGRLRFLRNASRQIEFSQRAWRPPVWATLVLPTTWSEPPPRPAKYRAPRGPKDLAHAGNVANRLDGYPKDDICDLGPGPGHRRSKKDSGPRAPATCPGPPCPGPRPGPNGAPLHPRSAAILAYAPVPRFLSTAT